MKQFQVLSKISLFLSTLTSKRLHHLLSIISNKISSPEFTTNCNFFIVE